MGLWHDALRDAPESQLREITGDATSPVDILHGPAAAALLARDGERRVEVLDAARRAVQKNPDDPTAVLSMLSAYDSKVETLQTMALLQASNDQ